MPEYMADEVSGKISDRVSFGGDQSKKSFYPVGSSSLCFADICCEFDRVRQRFVFPELAGPGGVSMVLVYLSSIDLLRFSSSTRALEPAKEPSGKATCRENLCASVCFVSRRCWRGDIFSQESLPMFRFRNEL